VALPYGFGVAAIANEIIERIDGLLLTGGGDISPDAFGGSPYAEGCVAKISFMSAERDVFEWAAVRAAWELDIPCLGICRGLQVMNVSFGGTLVRDISELGGNRIDHACFARGTEEIHPVRIERGTQLWSIIGSDELRVSSMHHQAVSEVARGAQITAWAPDGTPEGIEFPSRNFFVGVQWHPEQIRNTPQLFNAFVDAAHDLMG
jgi:putative glutamine amidotransferase